MPRSAFETPKYRARRGFSLLEVLVAFSIFAVVAVTVLEVFGTGIRNTSAARTVTKALLIAEGKLQETVFHVARAAETQRDTRAVQSTSVPAVRSWQGEAGGFAWRAEARREAGPPARTALIHIVVSVTVPGRAPVQLQTWRAVGTPPP